MRSGCDGTQALARALQERGGTVATALREPTLGGALAEQTDQEPGFPQRAAAGPRAAGHESEYELLLEMILEGSLLHYGAPRVVGDEDPDLALLLGDQLYALGLSRLAELGDVEAVAELADLISLEAGARAAGDGELVEAIWRAGATAIGWGCDPAHAAAKALARAGDGGALLALVQSAEHLAGAGRS